MCMIGKKIISLFFVVFSLMLLASCNKNEEHDFADEYRGYGNMLVLGLVNDTDLTENGVVYLEFISDNLNIQFANLTENNSEFILKLFLDYSETDFYINGELARDYTFQSQAGESIVLSVHLDSAAEFVNSRIFTVAVLTAPQKHAKSSDLMSNSYGVVLSYELAPKNGEREIIAPRICQDPLDYLELNYQGVMLNFDFKNVHDALVRFPPTDHCVEPGEKVFLAYRAGNYENANDILFVVLVDWKQQSVNNSDFLYVKNKPGYISYGTIEFTAPLEPGEYEITAFVVDQPFSLKDSDTFHTHDTAYRFTLTVE